MVYVHDICINIEHFECLENYKGIKKINNINIIINLYKKHKIV